MVGRFLELLQGIELSRHRHRCHERQVDAIALFSSQQWTICPEPRLVRLPGIREDVLQLKFSQVLQTGYFPGYSDNYRTNITESPKLEDSLNWRL